MKLVEHYIMRGTRRLVLIIVGFLIFIFASYSAQRYLTEAANGTLALDVVLDIVFYKVLIALEMLLPVGLYASVGVTLGQMYTDSEITAISAAGGSPGRLYKAVHYLAIPLSIFVTLLSMYGRPWAYAQIYQLEQQSQSELDVRQLRAKKFNTNDNGRMILSQTVDQDNNRLTDALIYTSTANRTRIFRARSVDVVDPSPEKPTVMLHNGTAYLLDHQGRDDNEQIYRNLQLHLNPLDQIGHGAGTLRLSSRSCRTAMATKPWPDSIVDGAAGHFIKSGKTAAGAIFNATATDVAVCCHFLWRRRLSYAGG